MHDLTEEEAEVLGLILRDSRQTLMGDGQALAKAYGVDPQRFIRVIEGLLMKFGLPREIQYPGEEQVQRTSKRPDSRR